MLEEQKLTDPSPYLDCQNEKNYQTEPKINEVITPREIKTKISKDSASKERESKQLFQNITNQGSKSHRNGQLNKERFRKKAPCTPSLPQADQQDPNYLSNPATYLHLNTLAQQNLQTRQQASHSSETSVFSSKESSNQTQEAD